MVLKMQSKLILMIFFRVLEAVSRERLDSTVWWESWHVVLISETLRFRGLESWLKNK